jgi:hypothetical protein
MGPNFKSTPIIFVNTLGHTGTHLMKAAYGTKEKNGQNNNHRLVKKTKSVLTLIFRIHG